LEILALLSGRDDEVIPQVKGALKRYTVYPLKTLEELEDLYSNIPLNLLLIDVSSHKLASLEDFLGKLDDDRVVLITSGKLDRYAKDNLPRCVFDSIDDGSIGLELPLVVERALERRKYRNGLGLVKQAGESPQRLQMNVHDRPDADIFPGRYDPVTGGRYMHEKVVVSFAKMLTASFDMQKLFDHFTDSVMEIARVNRLSVLLRDNDVFSIRTHYGLDPHFAGNLFLKKDSALVSRLAKTGRIISRPAGFSDEESAAVRNEMEILQCSVSFPMMYKGRLIGIFNIGSKITGEPFYREELEIIYVLCNYLAAAVKDIDFYHHMWYRKEFTDNILSSMSSGMIAIGRDEKVTVFNQQASEILKLEPSAVTGRDLRALPSPLGDILYETMTTGNTYRRYEVTVHPSNLPLGINSFRLHDEHRNPVGAGLVFTDLSGSKKLEEQQRMAEKLKAVNDLMAKVAHEVRNPLTSIQTYVQIFNEKNTDDELQNFYNSTVSQSIKRLDDLIDKLTTFSSAENYRFSREEVDDLIAESAEVVRKSLPETHKLSKNLIDKVFHINADKKQVIKAIYYLMMNIVERTPDGSFIKMRANILMEHPPFVEILITYDGDDSSEKVRQSMLKPLFDFENLGSELNIPISNKIIEGHGGSLTIKDREGINTFIIKLPIIDRRSEPVSCSGGFISGK